MMSVSAHSLPYKSPLIPFLLDAGELSRHCHSFTEGIHSLYTYPLLSVILLPAFKLLAYLK